MKNFHYTRPSTRTVEDALTIIQDAAIQEGYGILHVHDVAGTLKKKGYKIHPAYIVEVCQAEIAHTLITTDPLTLHFLPCKIAIFTEAGQTIVSAMLTSPLEHCIPGLNYKDISPAIHMALEKIVQAAL
jgi:uncharacterized protein (DUF302 family)